MDSARRARDLRDIIQSSRVQFYNDTSIDGLQEITTFLVLCYLSAKKFANSLWESAADADDLTPTRDIVESLRPNFYEELEAAASYVAKKFHKYGWHVDYIAWENLLQYVWRLLILNLRVVGYYDYDVIHALRFNEWLSDMLSWKLSEIYAET